jgi:outer membrane protein assembly factor BamC
MMRFGVAEERARAMVGSSGNAERARMSREKGGVLTVNEAFDRAWRRVGLALDRVGFTVEDRDRSQGIYFVRYINPDADNKTGGLLSKLLFWRDENADSADQYRVQLSEAGAATEVKVLNKDGAAEKSDTSSRILGLLYEQLK